MKLSFMTFACPTWPLDKVVDAAVRHHYQGIEFRTDATHAHGVEVTANREERGAIRRRLEGEGIAACCLATSLQFANEKTLRDAPARIELAADLGCPALRVFCGPRPEGLTAADLPLRVGDHLRAAADIATQHNVQLWLETHDSFCRAVDAAAAVRRADHPAVGINYDNMHPYRLGEDLEATFAALGDLIRHAHFHDAINKPDVVKILPLGKGELPMDDMFAALARTGYVGYLSGEWFNDMYGPDPDASLEQFKRDMQTLAERHGVKLG